MLEKPWDYAQNIVKSIVTPEFRDAEYNIADFGAINDGITDCSKAIQKAIETCSAEGGGKVIVPSGTFLTGKIHLLSNVNLHITKNAKLLFTTDKSKYLPVVHTRFEGMECLNYSPLIYAYKQENIAITGKGTIDGQGESWWNWKGRWSGSVDTGYKGDQLNQTDDVATLTQMVADNVPLEERIFGEGHYLRPSFISPYECRNILIEDITIKGSPMWIVHPVLSENVTVRNLKIESLGPNNDGCDPECCTNVLIEACYFNTGDDCIAIKSGRNNDGRRFGKPSKNIVIRNCTMVEGHGGVVIGSEISGNVSHVFAENCMMDSPNLDRAIRIKSNSVRGGKVEHIYVRDIDVLQVKEAILKINMFYATERADNIPSVSNVLLENVQGYKSKYGIWIEAYEEKPVQNIKLKNCDFDQVEEPTHIKNAEKLTFENVYINGQEL
ncbi:MAG: glycoside hydrolase family 28 protein [Bacteroidales bacterium]|nr:glycoside hydrolase family 28 protein [Bacteroidales bacterium]